MKVLVCIATHGERQTWCLEQLLREYKSWKYDVDVILHSNISLPFDENGNKRESVQDLECYEGVEVKIYDNLEDPHHLPFQTRQTIYDRKDDYDLYIYTENDHLITQKNIDSFINVTGFLPENKICGFFQYEQYDFCKAYPGAHAHFGWDFQTIGQVDGFEHVFASYSNPHQACYVLTKKQLHKVIDEIEFLELDLKSGFTPKCTVNTDIYVKPKWDKVLCISHWENFLVQHLPSRYLQAQCVIDRDFDPIIIEMVRQFRIMKLPYKYDENGNWKNNFSMNLYQYFE